MRHSAKHGAPSDPLRQNLFEHLDAQVRDGNGIWLSVGLLMLIASSVIYVVCSSEIIAHDPDYWAVDIHFTPFAGFLTIFVLAVLAYALLARKKWLPSIPFAASAAKIIWVINTLIIIAFFVELYLEVDAKSSASPIDQPRWYLAESEAYCRRRRSYLRNCERLFHRVTLYAKSGERVSVRRYGDTTRYYCALAQRIKAANGREWVKKIEIVPLVYERGSNGRPTKKGIAQLVTCTRRPVVNPI